MASNIHGFIMNGYRNASGIIYCPTRRKCEELAHTLQKEFKLRVKHYHAALDTDDRHRIQQEWQDGSVQVIVATIAFGMGIDKADVRFVIHCSLPSSLEGYYQETGRAGRDGLDAMCRLYYSFKDRQIIENFIQNGDGGWQQKERQRNNLRMMLQYCENVVDCRRQQVLGYFGERFDPAHCNKTCDNCLMSTNATVEYRDVTDIAKSIVALVRQLQSHKVTMLQAVDVFRGTASQFLRSRGLDHVPGTGAGNHLPKPECERIFKHLMLKHILSERCEANAQNFIMAYLQVHFDKRYTPHLSAHF